jgi:hypothetical protein
LKGMKVCSVHEFHPQLTTSISPARQCLRTTWSWENLSRFHRTLFLGLDSRVSDFVLLFRSADLYSIRLTGTAITPTFMRFLKPR